MGRRSKADQFLADLGAESGKPTSSDSQREVAVRLECLKLANTMQVRGEEAVLERAEKFTLWVMTGRK